MCNIMTSKQPAAGKLLRRKLETFNIFSEFYNITGQRTFSFFSYSSNTVSRVSDHILISLYFLGLVRLLRVTSVSRVTARSLQNNIVGCVPPSGERSCNKCVKPLSRA